MISFRMASGTDAETIAALHAESWKSAYANILSSRYLIEEVDQDRKEVWEDRFLVSPSNQFVILAENEDSLLGFVCIYTNLEYQYGSLIDNLHVKPHYKGKGLGKLLISKASDLIFEKCSTRAMHLWVYEDNTAAISFYEKIGGKKVEKSPMKNPDGTTSMCYRMYWETY